MSPLRPLYLKWCFLNNEKIVYGEPRILRDSEEV